MKRGRPRKGFGRVDKGINDPLSRKNTPTNKEPLDELLELGLIDQASHSAGMALRRLFVLKHGLPHVQSKSFMKVSGRSSPKYKDETWLATQQFVYNEAVDVLVKLGYYKIVQDICIYGIQPKFLTNKQNPILLLESKDLKDGLDVLKSIFVEYREILASKALN
jgi:hypothetical protein